MHILLKKQATHIDSRFLYVLVTRTNRPKNATPVAWLHALYGWGEMPLRPFRLGTCTGSERWETSNIHIPRPCNELQNKWFIHQNLSIFTFLRGCPKLFVIPYCCLIKRVSNIVSKILAGIIIPYNHQPAKGFEQYITMLNSIFPLKAGAKLSVLVDFPDAHPGWTAVISIKNITLFNHVHVQKWSMNCGEPQKRTLFLAVEFPYVACFVFRLSPSLPLFGSKEPFFKALTINSFQEPQRNISKTSAQLGLPIALSPPEMLALTTKLVVPTLRAKMGQLVSSISFRIWPERIREFTGRMRRRHNEPTCKLLLSTWFLPLPVGKAFRLGWAVPGTSQRLGKTRCHKFNGDNARKKTRVSYL